MIRTSSIRAISAAAMLVASAVGQASAGPFKGKPAGISVDELTQSGPVLLDHGQIYRTEVGLAGPVPSVMNLAPELPKFTKAAIFPGAAAQIQIDAISLGLDLIFSDLSGRAIIPSNAWGAVTFSVDRNATGSPGSTIRQEATNNRDGAAGDVFSYVIPGSVGPATNSIGVVQRSIDSEELGVHGGSYATRGDVDALDLFVPLFDESPAVTAIMMGLFDGIFVSLTSASAQQAPASWFYDATRNPNSLKSGASVLYVRWLPYGGWQPPTLFINYTELGLDQGDELTAFALDRVRLSAATPSERRSHILYSAHGTGAGILDQVMFAFAFASAPHSWVQSIYQVNADNSGNSTQYEKISGKLGLKQVDRVNAICALDPSGNSHPARAFMPYVFGTQTDPHPDPTLDASAFRYYDSVADRAFIKSYLTGHVPGYSDALQGLVYLVLPNQQLLLLHTTDFVDGYAEFEQEIPPTLELTGMPFSIEWGVFQHLQELGRSNRVSMKL